MLADTLMEFNTNNAHAYVVFGDRETNEKQLVDYFARMGIDTNQNPDVFSFSKKQFGIPEVRNVTSIVSRKNAQMEKKYITISTDAVTVEAQNALLKTIEEPTSPTIFFILLPEGGYVLETVRSRVQIITGNSTSQHEKLVDTFLQSEYVDRVSLLEIFYTNNPDTKKPELQKGKISVFLQELESEIAQLVTTGQLDQTVYKDYREVTQYILDRSASPKQIIEYVCMRVPVIK